MAMPDTPVTVLLTVKNGEPYIELAINSILNQTYTDFKFLLIDNASTDQTPHILKSFDDSRIERIFLPEDLGHTGALNYGLKRISTPYVARLDADDISFPTRLAQQMAYLKENPQIALLGTGCEIIDAQGEILSQHIPKTDHNDILEGLLFENQFVHSSVVYKHHVVGSGYDPNIRYAQDYKLWWQIALTHPVANLSAPLIQFRNHPNQGMQKFKIEAAEELAGIINEILDNPNLPSTIQERQHRAKGYMALKYAAALANNGKLFTPYYHLIKGVLTAPSMCKDRMAQVYIAQTLLRNKGFNLIRKFK